MENIKLFWDDFEIKARILPTIALASPIILFAIMKGMISANTLDVAIYGIISIVVITLLSKVIRNYGKKFEMKMYNKLGAMPTTIVLRYSDHRINELSKTRYHKKINDAIPGLNLPINSDGESRESDREYIDAMMYLRNYANANRDTEHMVYHALKEYNYWRNIYGGKYLAVMVYCITILIDIVIAFLQGGSIDFVSNSVLVMSGIIICLSIRSITVQKRAFDYAVALAEVCERV